MPDWSYCTLGKPMLFSLSPTVARASVSLMMGTVARLPFGGQLIDALGHMRRPKIRPQVVAGIEFENVVGLGACIDPDLDAIQAFERFGAGFIVIGPFDNATQDRQVARNDLRSEIRVPICGTDLTIEQAFEKLSSKRLPNVKTLLWVSQASDFLDLDEEQVAAVDGLIVPVGCLPRMDELRRQDLPVFLQVHVNDDLHSVPVEGFDGYYLMDPVVDGVVTKGPANLSIARGSLRVLKKQSPTMTVIVDCGVLEPGDAINLANNGADLLVADVGLVFGGPGMIKRINESIQANAPRIEPVPEPPATRSAWFWSIAMGLSMVLGGIVATVISLTRIVLPYDEALVGMTRFELAAVNDRLLDFMKHDRITLAGTMLSVGGLYMALAWFGMRRGQTWANVAVFVSAFVGFASFFLFLGFGYFDPFHAFVTVVLFQFLLLSVFSHDASLTPRYQFDLWNDGAWRRMLWGQLIFLCQGAALVVAGIVICRIGITSVFVQEDMDFMCTTPDKLLSANPRLVPLVAHDRATFGGMLVSCGIVVVLLSLWGFRRGESWVWWSLLLAGIVAYGMTIGIHHNVGYVDMKHLIPAYFGLASVLLGSWLTRGYLCWRHD